MFGFLKESDRFYFSNRDCIRKCTISTSALAEKNKFTNRDCIIKCTISTSALAENFFLLIVIAQKNLLIVIASKNKFTNRDCPMVTQTCRRTETLLNLGQMNGSSTS